jgi:predicted nucleic acid-binding protein
MYLLDTNVISESYKALCGRADPNVTAWLADVALAHCAISSLTLMELEIGVLHMERRDAAQGAQLRA